MARRLLMQWAKVVRIVLVLLMIGMGGAAVWVGLQVRPLAHALGAHSPAIWTMSGYVTMGVLWLVVAAAFLWLYQCSVRLGGLALMCLAAGSLTTILKARRLAARAPLFGYEKEDITAIMVRYAVASEILAAVCLVFVVVCLVVVNRWQPAKGADTDDKGKEEEK